MATNTSTPPNHPIYGVVLTSAQIVGLIQRVFPGSSVVHIKPLTSGNSFNNRIYFLSLKHHEHKDLPEEVVLKVIGRFFDERKIQNEVVNLTLLKKYCPDIPTPEIVAWSEDGKIIHSALTNPGNSDVAISAQDHKLRWVMMTKMPGRKITTEDLASEHAPKIADQLVTFINSWCRNMPASEHIGSFKINYKGIVTRDNFHDMGYRVEGVLFSDLQPSRNLTTPLEYYGHGMDNKVFNLKTKDIFTHLRKRILPQVEEFLRDDISGLPFLTVKHEPTSKPTFTHQDFAPRNFLVLDIEDVPVISGVVDFEFAGMFPEYEEYLNTFVKMIGDWPSEFWDTLMEKLAGSGLPAPLFGNMTSTSWNQGCDLIRLTEDVAPWWLEAGHVQGEELEKQLDEVADRVESLIKKLKAG